MLYLRADDSWLVDTKKSLAFQAVVRELWALCCDIHDERIEVKTDFQNSFKEVDKFYREIIKGYKEQD